MSTITRRHFLAASGAACLAFHASKSARASGPEEIFVNGPGQLSGASGKRPNVILILTDDLGFGDVGWLFQNDRDAIAKLKTPSLDRLVSEGVSMTDHYSAAPLCAPARGSIMTGKHQGHCNLRDSRFDSPIDPSMTLGTVMKAAGYTTYAIGKWGIGGGGESQVGEVAMPWRAGFDKAFVYKFHRDGHTYYHTSTNRAIFDETDTPVPDSVQKLRYDTDLFTARARAYIEDHLGSAEKEKPFFMYLAYTAIHGSYDANKGGALINTNFHIPGVPHDPTRLAEWPISAETPEAANTWNYPEFSEANGFTNAPRRRYATSVKRLDDCVGFLTDYLKEKGIDRNTLVIFTSDNGPTNEQGADPAYFISAGPFKGLKRYCWEGGLREPTLAWWPGTIPAGRIDPTPSQFQHWMPTLADAAGVPQPAHSDGVSLLPSMTGSGHQLPSRVYVEHIQRSTVAPYGNDHHVQMIREGDFVAIRRNISSQETPVELYNVVEDKGQAADLAKDPQHVNRARYMRHVMNTCRMPLAQCTAAFGFPGYGGANDILANAVRPYDNAPLPPVARKDALPPAEVRLFTDGAASWPWVPNFRTLLPRERFHPESLKAVFAECVRRAGAAPFGVSITGWLDIPETGTFTFTGTGGGGIQLWVHEAHILEYEKGDCVAGKSIAIPLQAGRHPFRLYATIPAPGALPSVTFNGQTMIG